MADRSGPGTDGMNRRDTAAGEIRRVSIDRLGAQGDGIADTASGPLFVPFALPGETVEVAPGDGADRGVLVSVVEASGDRRAPVCRHFGVCGGCALQHLDEKAYRAWKRGVVGRALANQGFEGVEVADPIGVGPGARRRAVLTATREGREAVLGFHEAGRHDLVDVMECAVLSPRIVALLPGLRTLLTKVMALKGETRVHVLAADNGLDVDLSGGLVALGPAARADLAKTAASLGLVRLSLERDPLYQSGRPFIRCGSADVVPPPGVFLQASAEAERLMAQLALAAIGKRVKKVADLFCGLGAFSFVLAERAKVLSIDNDTAALAALEEAQRRTQGLKAIETKARDLFQEPLSRKELEGFDLVVFDPPRAGAKAQAEMLAKSKVATVVAVSCNPATLARDLRTLVDGGYTLESVTPVDQFVFAPHVEVVAILRR